MCKNQRLSSKICVCSLGLSLIMGKCEGSRLVGGPGSWHSRASRPRAGTPTPLLGPPLPAATPPPPAAPVWEGARGKGQGVPAREGVPVRGFLELWAV